MRKTTHAVRAGLCAALLFVCSQAVRAQSAELPQVPDALADSLKVILGTARQDLLNEEARIRASAIAHDGKCRQVTPGSAMASACSTGRDSLVMAAAKLGEDREKFTRAVTELNGLIAEESTLSQSIRAAIARMQGMIDEVTAAGQEQLDALSEQLKRHLAARRQFRVRQANIVLAVRG